MKLNEIINYTLYGSIRLWMHYFDKLNYLTRQTWFIQKGNSSQQRGVQIIDVMQCYAPSLRIWQISGFYHGIEKILRLESILFSGSGTNILILIQSQGRIQHFYTPGLVSTTKNGTYIMYLNPFNDNSYCKIPTGSCFSNCQRAMS